MSQHDRAEYSFDIYGGLDDQLAAARARAAVHSMTGAEVENGGAPTWRSRAERTYDWNLDRDTAQWAESQLQRALGAWSAYEDLLDQSVPASLTNPDNISLRQRIERLCEARQAIVDTLADTPDSGVAERLELLIVPWQAFRDHLLELPEWVDALRTRQGQPLSIDHSQERSMTHGDRCFREPGAVYNDALDGLLSAQEYLDQRIEQDGPWGVLLVQTDDVPGLEQWEQGYSQDQDVLDGREHLTLAGYEVDAMSFIEYLALTFQVRDPSQVSNSPDGGGGCVSMLLANRSVNQHSFLGHPDQRVGGGMWRADQVLLGMYIPSVASPSFQPRIAVLGPQA